MNEWARSIQNIVLEIDKCIINKDDEALTLEHLAAFLGYSACYVSRKFREISGMSLREYLRGRKLAFALKDLRDTEEGILDVALNYGFSSHEAFTRAFKEAYGLTPSEYRRNPVPVVLRTVIKPFDCYLLEIGGTGMTSKTNEVRSYFVTIPEHKFLHIRNYESIGYWDFWQKQSLIPGQDCEAICGLLELCKLLPQKEGAIYYDAAVKMLRAMAEHCINWEEDDPGMCTMCTTAYHDAKGHHITMNYADYYFVEAITKLRGQRMLFWQPHK